MLTTESTIRPFALARRTAALAVVAGASTLAAHAQQVTPVAGPKAPQSLTAMLSQPLNLASSAAVNYSSSTSDVAAPVDTAAASSLDLGLPAELQPPPRRRYGRPRYNDSSHNPDGSNKYTFIVGAGASTPVNDFSNYNNLSYGFQVGAGRNFNKNVGLIFQFDYDNFGYKGATLANQLNLYNYIIAVQNSQSPANQQIAPLGSLDGSAHVWSFTLNPIYTLTQREGIGAYVVGGVGFYHKAANFTTPATGVGYDPYYGYYQYTANQPIDQYFSNAVGFNGGFGLTYKPSKFAGERLYAEVRYNYMLNSARQGITLANVATASSTANFSNLYPQNSNRTAYLPVKVGIRF